MKKAIIVLGTAAMLLTMGGVASASPSTPPAVVQDTPELHYTVTFTPANPGQIQAYDQTVPLSTGSSYFMSGSSWVILSGSNVVSLSGNKATMIAVGTAQVKAFKANGDVLGIYTFVVSV
ncbi:hypothetical protein [Paenibacillus sacheonensis]|uniref:BIG2 domain-containing protein n=1 Tax=Paenibacillus sacheonensis TaxID=742054 RepID=A0A7X4YQ05_9BACL|nr:hypothetical protein [Paenibacillus sacheonensis]MBM7566148.1 hypothetical protein [Paenibacillus sacheonensis]NBC70358.1 hypothetical protein [Paenibacillus sacheonensis]